nr:unnamed protein product [Callosobruchus chinensis]
MTYKIVLVEKYYRKHWPTAHQDWLLPQCRNVLFSDESRLRLGEKDWRERGGQNRLATAIGVAPYHGGTQIFVITLIETKLLHCNKPQFVLVSLIIEAQVIGIENYN